MSWIIQSSKFIPAGILNYFAAGFTEEEVLANLLKSHQTLPDIFPRIDHRDVAFWFDSFRNGNHDLSQQTATTSRLETLPVLDMVMNKLDARDQASLRQTSKAFKDRIDKQERLFGKIVFKMNTNSVLLYILPGFGDKYTQTTYQVREGGCNIKVGEVTTQSEKTFIEAAIDAFKAKVEPLNTKVGKLVIRYNKEGIVEENRVQLLTGIGTTMSGLREKLSVECLEMTMKTPAEFDSVLSGIMPGSLETIDAESIERREDRFLISECTAMPAHWEHLQSFCFQGKKLDLDLDSFARIPFVFLELAAPIQEEQMRNYKNALLNNQNLIKHTIYNPQGQGGLRKWGAALEPFNQVVPEYDEDYEEDAECASIAYPEPSQDRVEFTLGNPFVVEKKSA